MKRLLSFAVILLLLPQLRGLFAQADSARWLLTSSANTTPATFPAGSSKLSAAAQTRGTSYATAPTYSSSSFGSGGTGTVAAQKVAVSPPSGAAKDANGYVQFTVNPIAGYNYSVSKVSVFIGSGGGTALGFSMEYSLNSDFSSPVVLGTSTATSFGTKDLLYPFSYSPAALSVTDGQTLYLRIYGWYPSTSARTMNLYDFRVEGTASLAGPATTATVTTNSVTNISGTSATSGGNVTSDGGVTVTEKGIVYSTNPTPTVSDTKVIGTPSNGSGSFTADLSGLSPVTTYYVRAYAINSQGTSYGSQQTFATVATEPTTQASNLQFSATNLSTTTLTFTPGNGAKRIVVAKAGSAVDAVPVDGTVYSANSAFGSAGSVIGTNNYVVYNGSGNSVTVSGLNSSTTYYFAIYEYNDDGSGNAPNYLTTSPATASVSTNTAMYRSKQSGDWNVPSTWELSGDNGANFTPATTTTPTSADDAIVIQDGHTITVTANVSADQLTVSNGGSLVVASGITFSIADGTGTDLTLNGAMKTIGTFAQATGSTMAAASTAVYEDATPSTTVVVTIPKATWASGSKTKITGLIGATSSGTPSDYNIKGMNQSFSKLEVDVPNMTGKLVLTNTGLGFFAVTDSLIIKSTGPSTNTFGLQISSSGARTNGVLTAGQDTVAIGNYYQTGGIVSIIHNSANSTPKRLIVNGNFIMQGNAPGNVFNIAAYTTGGAGSTLELKGNLAVSTTDTFHRSNSRGTGGSATVLFTGTNQTANFGSYFNNVAVVGTSAADVTIGSTTTTPVSAPMVRVNSNLPIPIGATLLVNTGSSLIMAPPTTLTLAGTATLNNQSVTFKSDATGTATLGQVTGALTGATNITVERYMGTIKRAWRLLTAPVTGTTIKAAWQEGRNITSEAGAANEPAVYGTLITGGSAYPDAATANAQGYDYLSGTGSPSIRIYTPAVSGGNWASGLPTTSAIDNQQAYMLFVRGDRTTTSGVGSTVLRATGAYKTGAAVPVLTSASHTLIGNPYPSSIDFEAIYQTNNTEIQHRFWIWDATAGTFGAYKLINYNGTGYEAIPAPFTAGTGSVTDLATIRSGQGFFVEPTAGGTLDITEAHKTSAAVTTPIFRTGNGTAEKLWINLNQVNADNTVTLADGVQARYDNSYTTADNIGKATNFNENLAIARGGSNLIVQSRQLIDNSDTVFLKLWNTTARNYQFQLKADNFSNAPLTAYLEDKYLKTSTPVSLDGGISNVNFAVTSDAASADADRFMVVFKSLGVLPVSFTTVKAYEKERNIQVEWKVATETNTKAYEVEKSTNGRDFAKAGTIAATASGSYSWLDITPAAGNNFYRIKVIDNGGEAKYSSIVRVNITKGTKGIGVYPNPITGNQFILELKNKLAGKYTVKLYNTAGQTLFTTTITHAGGSSTEAMSLPALSEGVYQLEVTDEGGAKDIIKLLKK